MAGDPTEKEVLVVVSAHSLIHSARHGDRISAQGTSAFRVTGKNHEPIGVPKRVGEENRYAPGVMNESSTLN
jgi:hypothetical protein